MINKELPKYKYNGARSLVLLHEKHLRSFVTTWREAKLLNISLPKTEDQDYQSLVTLLRHVLRSAGNYMIWICNKLELPSPEIIQVPDLENIENEADNYLNHIIEKWGLPLINVEEEKFHSPTYKSNWGVDYCIDAMLEHAVMHPIRHEFQLRNLINAKK
ncbi:MAG: hypothetical protein KDC88_07625 [Ignavibacteriae bacterium]|nr:hypothetical protein [Ignavibacteriota bacterium]MCB0743831.1 hypothetical protein [Ignavibacteriota bacterium]MCB9208398.1 hypothetical protein [Ignavibacteriales bacterium]MCB9259160.1 hypothetical protein [Ignavibacteriales bacterium]